MGAYMSKKEVTEAKPTAAVTNMPTSCVAEGCKAKSTRLNFCVEHFEWFKEGLVTKTGQRPKDFDKKYINFLKKKAA